MKQTVYAVSTTEKDKWRGQEIHAAQGTGQADILVTGEKLQTIRGFGGCFNEMGYSALMDLPEADREHVIRELFSEEGCNFTYCRMPIGASDFAESWYSLNETENDFSMEHFTIERDKKCLIPYIQMAKKQQKNLQIFASPWSPPTWLKHPRAYNFGTLIQEPAYRKAYALYFKKFIEAYEKEGIHIQAVHIQNEPVSDQKFPSCVWTGEELRDFIREDIGPLFAESGMDTEIWLGTLNCPYEDYGGWEWQKTNFNRMANLVLRDPEASRYIRGISYQWGGKHALYDTRRAYPNVEIIQTENECGDGNNSWGYMEYIFHLLWFYFEHGVTAYVYWNMVLKQGGLSTWGWRQNSLFCTDGDRLIYNPEFYLIKHVCHFVRPQASFMRIEGSFANNTLCFRNPDGSTVVVVLNPLDTEEELRICVSGEEWVFCAKPHSIQTIVIEK